MKLTVLNILCFFLFSDLLANEQSDLAAAGDFLKYKDELSSADVNLNMQLIDALPLSNALLTRGPYLQKATTSSIIVRWRTDINVNSKVLYGLSPTSLTQNETISGTRTEHSVQLTGLSPNTRYYYSVGYDLIVIQGSNQNYFVTNPLPNTEGKYTFWVTGDCGNNSTNQINVLNQYLNFIGDSVTHGWLLLGDNAYSFGTDQEYTTNFFNIYQPTIMKHAPIWPVPGNHDYGNSATSQDNHNVSYYSIFDLPVNGEAGGVPSNNEAFYSYDYGNIHFLALDSYGEESNKRLYDTTGTQVQWIKQDLVANHKKWTIAYWHHPPYTMGSHNSDTESELILMRTNFVKMLESYGVDLIMCGHSHSYERSKLMKGHYGLEPTFNATTHNISTSSARYDGSTNSCPYRKDSVKVSGSVYIVAGSAGQLGGQQTAYPHNAMFYSNTINGGSLILQVDGRRLDGKWLCSDGIIRDQFNIYKDAGQKKDLFTGLGQAVSLTASWSGNYIWSTALTTQSINVTPPVNSAYVVRDALQCVSDTFTVTIVQPVTLTLHLLLQAFITSNTAMRANLYNLNNSINSNDVDTVSVKIYQPFNLSVPYSSTRSILKTNGTLQAVFPVNIPNGPYYISVRHRNSLETWSKTPVSIAGNTEFDFIYH